MKRKIVGNSSQVFFELFHFRMRLNAAESKSKYFEQINAAMINEKKLFGAHKCWKMHRLSVSHWSRMIFHLITTTTTKKILINSTKKIYYPINSRDLIKSFMAMNFYYPVFAYEKVTVFILHQ